MKKLYLLLFLLIFAFGGCNDGSGSSSGGGGGGASMNGNWSGQWSAKVEVYVPNPNATDDPSTKYIKQIQPLGGPLSANLQLNGRQLTGTISSIPIFGNQPARFSATESNPSSGGNIEVGTAYAGPYSISFHGTYNNQQIYCVIGPSSSTASGTIFEGNFTLTK